MTNPPDRSFSRKPIRSSGVVSAAEIMKRVAESGIQDDNDQTGTMGIRDSATLRKNAESLRKGK